MSAEDILQFLRLLDKAPKSRRNWRLLQGHCRRCGHLAVEVFRTPVETAPIVAVYTGLKRTADETYSILGVSDKGIRDTAPTVSVLLSENQDGLQVACKCGKRVVSGAALFAAIRAGESAMVLDTPG